MRNLSQSLQCGWHWPGRSFRSRNAPLGFSFLHRLQRLNIEPCFYKDVAGSILESSHCILFLSYESQEFHDYNGQEEQATIEDEFAGNGVGVGCVVHLDLMRLQWVS